MTPPLLCAVVRSVEDTSSYTDIVQICYNKNTSYSGLDINRLVVLLKSMVTNYVLVVSHTGGLLLDTFSQLSRTKHMCKYT